MRYQCLDCSYRGTAFPAGACPACGSRNVRKAAAGAARGRVEARKPFRISLAGAVWLLFLVTVYRQFFMR